MRQYPLSRYVAGAKKKECPRCGFDCITTEMIFEERTGYLVCKPCYDPVHPQDLPKRKNLGTGVGGGASATDPIYSEEN